jgi:hypothetical protein
MTQGKPIIYEQAPCQPDGYITNEGQGESKEGSCYCLKNPRGCCVDGFGIIIPKTLKPEFAHLAGKETQPTP